MSCAEFENSTIFQSVTARPEKTVFQHDFKLSQGNFIDTEELRFPGCRQDYVRALLKPQVNLAAPCVRQFDQGDYSVLDIRLLGMILGN